MTTPEERLAELGLTVPDVVPPVAAYVPAVRSGSYVYTAGQLPMRDGALIAAGKVGHGITPEVATACAQQCALNAIAAIRSVAGDLASVDGTATGSSTGAPTTPLTIAGQAVGPAELEAAVLQLRQIGERAAVGIPDAVSLGRRPAGGRCPRDRAVGSRNRGNGRSRPNTDLLQARRRTWVRTNQNGPANRGFSLERPTIGGPRVRNQSDPTQTHKPTAHTEKACNCRPSQKRLKGFEPSTFCMASRNPQPRFRTRRHEPGLNRCPDRRAP